MADLVFGVSPQVREEACEKARSEWVAGGFDMSHADWELRPLVDAAIPVIAGAAYKEGLLKALKVMEAAQRLVDTINGMEKGAEKMGGQWYFPDPVLEDRDALRAALAAIDKEGETNE